MNINYISKLLNLAKPVSFLMLLTVVASCTKTEYEQLKRPYNAIQSFRVGGYNDLDSINAVIDGNEIKLYWSADAAKPGTIIPMITLSAGAAISPASGTAVAFSENTVYTVTAEDGTIKEYKLKPIFSEAIPVLSQFPDLASWSWGTKYKVKIDGQYFLTNNDASKIRVYAQRMRDGYEFDLAVDQELTTGTQLVVDLPKFTTEQDSGRHKIWVQVGEFPSNVMDIWIAQPKLNNIMTSFTLREAGQTIYIGDTITFVVGLNPKIDGEQFAKYITADSYYFATCGATSLTNSTNTIRIADTGPNKFRPVIKGNEIKMPLTETNWGGAVGYYLTDYRPNFYYQSNAMGTMSVGTFEINPVASASTYLFLDYGADLETQRKTVIARRN